MGVLGALHPLLDIAKRADLPELPVLIGVTMAVLAVAVLRAVVLQEVATVATVMERKQEQAKEQLPESLEKLAQRFMRAVVALVVASVEPVAVRMVAQWVLPDTAQVQQPTTEAAVVAAAEKADRQTLQTADLVVRAL